MLMLMLIILTLMLLILILMLMLMISLCQKKLDFGLVLWMAVLECQYKAACKF